MDPAAFMLGCSQPNWLAYPAEPGDDEPAPLFVAVQRLYGRLRSRQLPRAAGRWALDSGGFNHVATHGAWTVPAETYAEQVWRLAHGVGNLQWAAAQDWMCEPFILARTGLDVTEHQALTVDNFRALRRQWDILTDRHAAGLIGPFGRDALLCPFRPVLQGWQLDDYFRCADMYERSGVHLAGYPLVGLGSVCRRQATSDIALIVERLHTELDLPLHGFGIKSLGLERYGAFLSSSDSHAWSTAARRRERYCQHNDGVRWERNCRQYALEWRDRLLTRMAAADIPQQMRLF